MAVRRALCFVLVSACSESTAPCEPRELVRGPWAVGLYTREAEIRWETAEMGCGGLRFAFDGSDNWLGAVASQTTAVTRSISFGEGDLESPDQATTGYIHRVALRNLTPNMCYRYQISQKVDVHYGRVCTASEANEATSTFALIGSTEPTGESTATLYGQIAASAPHAVFHLGDIQHYSNTLDSWSAWFERTQNILSTAPILPVVGEQEFEVLDTGDGSSRGVAREYLEYFQPLWAGDSHARLGDNYALRVSQVVYIMVDSQGAQGASIWSEEGRLWLEQILTQAEREDGHAFSVILMHRPPYTRSSRRLGLTRREALRNMLDGHRVPLIIAGDATCYERFEVDGRTFIVSGGGGSSLESCNQTHPDSGLDAELMSLQQLNQSTHHWVQLSQSSTGLRGEVIAEDGTMIDQWEVQP